MKRKYSTEQLSRILGEHDAGNLRSGGGTWPRDMPKGCIEQAALNLHLSDWPWDDISDVDSVVEDRVQWFNRAYHEGWTPEDFLAAIEGEGLA